MSLLPTDDKQRKMLPMFKMITGYFPKALREVTRVCVANNVRYNPNKKPQDINWARGKSTDQLGSLFRHILEAQEGLIFEDLPPEVQAACGEGFDRVYVLAEAAWRALAALELQIEDVEAQVAKRTDRAHPEPCNWPVDPCCCSVVMAQRVPPLVCSEPELHGIRVPHCPGCGVIAGDIHKPGCNRIGV